MSDGLKMTLDGVPRVEKLVQQLATINPAPIEKQAKVILSAAQFGLSALRSNVAGIGAITARLRASPKIKPKTYGNTSVAIVGLDRVVAPHGHLVEEGTSIRKLKKGFIFSSWNRNKWSGKPIYPKNFIFRNVEGYVGRMPALHPVARAFDATRSHMASTIAAGMQNVVNDALKVLQ